MIWDEIKYSECRLVDSWRCGTFAHGCFQQPCVIILKAANYCRDSPRSEYILVVSIETKIVWKKCGCMWVKIVYSHIIPQWLRNNVSACVYFWVLVNRDLFLIMHNKIKKLENILYYCCTGWTAQFHILFLIISSCSLSPRVFSSVFSPDLLTLVFCCALCPGRLHRSSWNSQPLIPVTGSRMSFNFSKHSTTGADKKHSHAHWLTNRNTKRKRLHGPAW